MAEPKKTLLILTQYYPPETGAPQNRLHSLALNLKENGFEVKVLTAMPNYPKGVIQDGYKGKWHFKESIEGIPVFRSWIYTNPDKTNITHRLINYLSFAFTSFWAALFRTGKCDIILCESPPLFLGITAFLLKVFKNARLVFNVSDLWPESAEKLGLINNRSLLSLATSLEEFIYRHSDLVSGQTMGIVNNISRRMPDKHTCWLPNGVDFTMFSPEHNDRSWRQARGFSEDDFVLIYAGILGHAQGLEVIMKAAARLRHYPGIRFIIMGDGPEKEKLVQMKEQEQLHQVSFEPNTPRHMMPSIIAGIDAAIVPLKKLDIFTGAIPSKVFEPLAYGKPILLGVDGEARSLFIDEGKAGLYFEPENHEALAECIETLYKDRGLRQALGTRGQAYVKQYFDRRQIAQQFARELHTL